MPADAPLPGGIQSLDAALRVLATLADRGGAATLTDLARACAMPPSKVHRYLTSFHNAGLVDQAARSGQYTLGPQSLRLGLAALARHDFVNRAADGLAGLATETGMSALLSVWGSQGPTVVRWERAEVPTVTAMGLGTTMPLLNSATGRAFLTWAPPAVIAPLLAVELARARKMPGLLPDVPPTEAAVETLRSRLRTQGFAAVDGSFIPGLVALAAPILDWQAQAQAVITLIGTTPEVLAPGASQTRALIAFCTAQSFAPSS